MEIFLPQIWTQIESKYTILDFVGQGSFGQVVKAQSKTTLKSTKGPMKFSVSSMLNKKKVSPDEVAQPKKSYTPAGGMAQFFKKEGGKAQQPKNSVPMLFK